MKCIKKITDDDFNIKPIPFNKPKIRQGARGIIFNDIGEIAILNKKNKNEYKLVGGGVEDLEDPVKAFKREALEESGCEIEVDDCLGVITEEKSQDNFIQNSYVYVGHVIKDTKQLHLTTKEIDEGSALLWLDLKTAMKLIEESENNLKASKYENLYHSRFIARRDYFILKYYLNHNK